ncbi:hypothetical protein FHS85_000216 [Rhodoligotrophos appendicifer]|uniref:DUF2628 domain-containing protein n=1 Tax=Rhodoligotrophos appendicifer TaxID=987056 RepID=UPI00117DC69D|nr:DUF2628 domain-containing protein [Rhodoligotrophos appendicifer]
MKTFTVHHRERNPEAILADPDGLEVVKEGFSWPAFFIPLLWLIYKRMWLVLVLFLVVNAALAVIGVLWPMPGAAETFVALAVNLFMGLQGNDLRRWTLARRGKAEVGVVMGDDLLAAEHRFFSLLASGLSAVTPPVSRVAPPLPGIVPVQYSILPEPGRT